MVQTKRLPDPKRPYAIGFINTVAIAWAITAALCTLTARSPPHARPRHCVDGAAVVVIAFCAVCQAERADPGVAKLRVVASGPTKRSCTTC